MGNVVARIPLTGGPKGGKTKIKEEIKKMIEMEYGYKVFLVPETATEIIEAGFIPADKPEDNDPAKMEMFVETNIAFQQMILDLQLAKESAFEIAARACPEDVVIIYDRGVMDNKGYLMMRFGDNGIFERMLLKYNLTVDQIMDRYDAVLSLETSASITDFNSHAVDDTTKRIEAGNKEAMEVDYFVSKVWEEHPSYKRIDATEDFNEKIEKVLNAIRRILRRNKVKRFGTL